MRHKKKRTQNQAASLQHPRNPDKLDYSDESSAADTPLDSQEYQRAIRAHLNEFEDMATNPLNGYSSKDGLDGVVRHTHTIPRIPPLPTSNRHPPSAKAVTKKNNSKSGATNGTNASAPRDRIWNTTTNEERERIKEFWLNLGEEERKSLVKVEKEAVLKKMKEQQKHSCSCSVCGRKRTAIEEELEVLYDAYYEELEQYANQQQFPSQSSITAPRQHAPRSLRQSKITEVLHSDDSEGSFEDEEEEDDDLSEDDLLTDDDISDGDDNYSEVEYEEDHAPPEFFRFGNSLTVKGGILTVADDLLKNDGKKFIEMMEQLAERRMQREEEAAMEAREYDDEEEDDYDDEDIESDEYDEDDEEQDALTEEQRMAEGRRMFQIFAARMFEQRVLTAYREKVAQERQAQLLQELELEDSREKEREAKKLKEKEKKKDKKRQQQLKKEEEKAKKEAERLAEETALKAEEERKAEEARKRKEEQRQKREAEKKAIEAEKGRKEEEKRKRLAEEKAREAKRLEQIAKDKKAKEEAQRKEREAKEAAAKEAKAKKDAAKAQREAELAAAETEKLSISQPANVVPQGQQSRRISPVTKPASPALAASPAIPIAHNNSHKDSTTRSFQDANHTHSGPRSIPVQQQQFQPPMGRSMTPGAISPQYSQKQNSFPRAALGHPPSMPVPLPPPGIGGSHGTALPNHDPFGFNTQQPQPSMQLPPRQTTLSTPQIPGMQGPPGVFSIAPGLKTSTSPQPRVSTPQGARMQTVNPFNAFSGLGGAPASTPRDDFVTEPELTFARRPNGFVSEPSHNGISAIGAIGAIGRPSPARNASTVLPAPIQRPSTLVPASVSKQTGFEGRNVMGSRALLDDDDDAVVPDNTTTSSIFNGAAAGAASSWTSNSNKTTTTWTGSAALNGTADDEPYHPPARETRWGSSTAAAAAATAIGTIGVKTSTPVDNNNNNGGGGSSGGSGTFKQAGKWGF